MILFTSNDQAPWLRTLADTYGLNNLIIIIKELDQLPIYKDFPLNIL